MSRFAGRPIDGRTIVGTDAASGIGGALAQRPRSHGRSGALAALDDRNPEQTVAEFAALILTQSDKVAEIVHRRVEQPATAGEEISVS